MKKFFKHPWVVGIGTAAVGGVISSLIVDFVNGDSIFSAIGTFFSFLARIVVEFFNLQIKVWCLLVFGIVVVIMLIILSKYLDRKQENEKPSFLDYTSDSFWGICWEWTYEKQYDGKYMLDEVYPLCPKCKMALKRSYGYWEPMKCVRCNIEYNIDSSNEDDAKLMIQDNIKKKYLQKRPQ